MILCIGHAFARNYGDRAIFNVLKEGLAQVGLRARRFPIKPISINRKGHLMGPVGKVSRGLFLLPPHYVGLWRRARASSAVLMGAGNPMMDIHVLHAIQFLLICLVVRAAGRRFWIFGGGAGPLRTWIGRVCMSAACHLAEGVTVRDSFSVAALKTCPGLDRLLSPDVVPDLVLGQSFPQRCHEPNAPLRVGISAIHYRHPQRSPDADPAAYSAYLDRLERVIRLVVERLHAEVLVFTNEPMEDQETVGDVMARVRDVPGVRSVEVHSVRSAVTTAGMCDLQVGGRLHSVIFSLVQGIPAIALSSHGKIVGLYADLEASDLVYDIGSFDPEAIVANLEQLRGERGRCLLKNVTRLGSKSAAGLTAMAEQLRRFVDRVEPKI
jgi:polysaccharide pyruvyl transferase WcaK-like protein